MVWNEGLRVHNFHFLREVTGAKLFILLILAFLFDGNVLDNTSCQGCMTLWRTWLLTFGNCVRPEVILIDYGLIHWMDLVGVILNPFFCFIIFWIVVPVFLICIVHLLEGFFGCVKFVLLLYNVLLVNIGSFEPILARIVLKRWALGSSALWS